jgi:RNA polymerase subunit RPABC4/transcription elongation factor Spt4
MTCTNPSCPNPKKDHLFLFAGKLCEKCKHLFVERTKMGRPVGEVPYDKATYQKQYHKDNPRTEYHRNRMRIKQGVEKGMFIIECGGQFRTKQWTGGKMVVWGERSVAKVYQSRKLAEYAVRMIGKGNVVKI